jgi:hypothetical protein
MDFSSNILLKVEYLRNLEHGPVPNFDNDVFTASLVLVF